MTLNTEQQKAVDATEGPVLIIAGAGAGKTRVITQRILGLMRKGVPPHNILAITFTNKAAKEMRERVDLLLSEDKTLNLPITFQERPFISTFHALGVHILRENARLIGRTRHFTIYDRSDSRRAIKEAMEKASIDPKKFEPGAILNKISLAKGEGTTRLAYIDRAGGAYEEMIAAVWEHYENILEKDKALDFDDLLLTTCGLLENHADIRKRYQETWKYIHIDEYQDTNKVQYKIARFLTSARKNICVVGDADQNIYSWRGATIENILNFEKDYPEAKIIILEKNYRSTKTILDAANMVIEKNTLRKKKRLYTDNSSGEKISLLVSYTETDEARAIADTAKNLIAGGASPSEIAVLYRANFQSRALEEFFIKKNIPYQLLGTKFFERKEVKDVLSYIRAALNHEAGEAGNESWGDISRIINVPPRGIGKVTLAKILSGQTNSLPSGTVAKINDFFRLLADMKKDLTAHKPSESVKFVIRESGIEAMLQKGDSEDEERLRNIQELVSVAAQYDNEGEGSAEDAGPLLGIEKFLENAALATDQDELEKNSETVKLMTVHAAKGLEFDTVFVAGLEQELFPYQHLGEEEMTQNESEEERRLFYVALTRAKKKIYLSYTIIRTIYGSQKVNIPSEFIEDIAPELIDSAPPEKPSGAKALFIDF